MASQERPEWAQDGCACRYHGFWSIVLQEKSRTLGWGDVRVPVNVSPFIHMVPLSLRHLPQHSVNS